VTSPRVAIYSIFRDNEGEYIDKYFERIDSLEYPKEYLRVYCGEGDSKDDTWHQLCDIEGFTYEEISKIIDVPIGTVRSRLFRARNMLKAKLKDYARAFGYKDVRGIRHVGQSGSASEEE